MTRHGTRSSGGRSRAVHAASASAVAVYASGILPIEQLREQRGQLGAFGLRSAREVRGARPRRRCRRCRGWRIVSTRSRMRVRAPGSGSGSPPTTMSPAARSGARRITSSARMVPIEWPSRSDGCLPTCLPRASVNDELARRHRRRDRRPHRTRTRRCSGLRPEPGRSIAMTRHCPARASDAPSAPKKCVPPPSPCRHSSTGAPAPPHASRYTRPRPRRNRRVPYRSLTLRLGGHGRQQRLSRAGTRTRGDRTPDAIARSAP